MADRVAIECIARAAVAAPLPHEHELTVKNDVSDTHWLLRANFWLLAATVGQDLDDATDDEFRERILGWTPQRQ